MTETSAVQCPRCKKHLRQTAHLPAEGQLPAVSGYWCEDCKIEHTVEEDWEQRRSIANGVSVPVTCIELRKAAPSALNLRHGRRDTLHGGRSMPSIMRTIAVSIIGAAFGLAMIRLGFNLRFGGYGSSWWLSGPDAYIPAAVSGTLIALFIDWTLRKQAM